MTEYTGESRFKRVEFGAALPAACVLTNESRDLVDLGRTIFPYGRLYLSVDVIRELAEVAGIIQPEARSWNRESMDNYTREVTDVLDDAVDRIRLLGAAVGSDGHVVRAEADAAPVKRTRRKRKSIVEDADGPRGQAPDDESGTDSAGSSEGLDDVPGDSRNEGIVPAGISI